MTIVSFCVTIVSFNVFVKITIENTPGVLFTFVKNLTLVDYSVCETLEKLFELLSVS